MYKPAFIATNEIHAGVIRPSGQPDSAHRCRLKDVPLDVPIRVTISGADTKVGGGEWQDGPWHEAALLSALTIDGSQGPNATLSWLNKQLVAEAAEASAAAASADSADAHTRSGSSLSLAPGMLVLTATPGSLVRVRPACTTAGMIAASARVLVEFDGIEVECQVDA